MKRMLVVVLSLALLLIGSVPAGAQATKTPYTSVIVFEEVIDPGTVRVTPSGMLFVRGEVTTASDVFTIEGEEFPGDLTLTTNVNLNLETLQGVLYGTYELDVPGLDTWTGTFRGVITGGLSSGTYVGHGVAGTKDMGSWTEVEPGVLHAEGELLLPPGTTG